MDSESNENKSDSVASDGASGTGGGNSWWGSWINSTKEKTFTVLEAVKKDLDELSTTFQNEASNVGAAIENTLKFDNDESTVGTVKKSLSSFFGQVTDALIPSFEEDEVEAVLITHDGQITLTGFPKHLADLQMNEKTYTESPDLQLKEKYKRWMEVIEQDQFTQDRLAKHLSCSEILNEKYTTLVPDKVSHMEFWQRYLFKRALLEDALANAEIAERRAETDTTLEKSIAIDKCIVQTEQPKITLKEKEIINEEKESSDNETVEAVEKDILNDWDNEELNGANIELSEEEQIRLLEEYEQEINEREKKKPVEKLNDKKAPKIEKKNSKTKQIEKKTKQTPSDSRKNITETSSNKNDNKQKNVTEVASNKNDNKQKNVTEAASIKNDNKQKNLTEAASIKNDNKQKNVVKGKTTTQNNKTAQEEPQKDKEESSSTSDESWETDFDLNDV